MSVTLQTAMARLDFLVDGDRFTSYHYDSRGLPGFSELLAPGARPVTGRNQDTESRSLWIDHGDDGGEALSIRGEGGLAPVSVRIRQSEITAHRGYTATGFLQVCEWRSPTGTLLLTDSRTARISAGPGECRALDLTLRLQAGAAAVALGSPQMGLVFVRIASSLTPAGGGRIVNGLGDEGLKALNGRATPWCGCMGVVKGETVGLVIMDHPDNWGHPSPWLSRPDGVLSPGGLAWRAMEIEPHEAVRLRYRFLVHRGYVESQWPEARMSDFAATSASL